MPWSKPSTFHTISFGTRRPIQIEFLLQAAVLLFQPSYVLLQTSCFNVANGFPLLCTRCINKGLFAQNEAELSSLIRLFGSGSADNYGVVFPPLCIFNMLQIPYACGISCLFAWVSSEVNFSKEQCGKEESSKFPRYWGAKNVCCWQNTIAKKHLGYHQAKSIRAVKSKSASTGKRWSSSCQAFEHMVHTWNRSSRSKVKSYFLTHVNNPFVLPQCLLSRDPKAFL